MIRYKRLGFVELNVSDLDKSRYFYETLIGLQFVGTGSDGSLRFRCGDDPYNIVLHQGDSPGYKRAGWMMESLDQFPAMRDQLKEHGVPFEIVSEDECVDRGFSYALRIVEPGTKATVEFYCNSDADAHYFFKSTVASIQRLGHVVYATPNFEEAVDFYQNVLNFAESDSIQGLFTFMRPWPNPYHHGLGVGKMPNNVYHHTNFMVSEVDDVGKAIHRLNEAGVPIVHGPGRHPASGSVFLYFLDPGGLTCEYSYGMEQFHEGFERPPREIPLTKGAGDSWGAPMDPRMGKTGVIEPYTISES